MTKDAEAPVEAIHQRLLETGAVEPVRLGDPEERQWLDCDLASFAENRLGDLADPRVLDEPRRAHWASRATQERQLPLVRRTRFERCYWLRDKDLRAGTIALSTMIFGVRSLRVASLYVFPDRRRRGVAQRALDRVEAAAGADGFGVRLGTEWSWQAAVRFYLERGMWLRIWKHDLEFCSDSSTPPPMLEIDESSASVSVSIEGRKVLLAAARRVGESLEWESLAVDPADEETIGDASWLAETTLSLLIAMNGWPLIRSPAEWERHRGADAMAPEALACKIQIWEAWDRNHGWRVDTPRIAGLRYPTWAELEAEWANQ